MISLSINTSALTGRSLSSTTETHTPSFNPEKLNSDPTFKEGLIQKLCQGNIAEGHTEYDSTLDGHELYQYKGLVYRSELSFRPEILSNGFESKNDLSNPQHYRESTGIGINNPQTGQTMGVGATGQSGVSTAKDFDHCKNYGNIHYVIDTKLLPSHHKAFDMESNTVNNRLNYDGSNEVNITHIPNYAIIGVFGEENPSNIKSLPAYYGEIMMDEEAAGELKQSMIDNYQKDHPQSSSKPFNAELIDD